MTAVPTHPTDSHLEDVITSRKRQRPEISSRVIRSGR